MDLLREYDQLLSLSKQMEAQARRQEWDSIDHLEQQRASILKYLPKDLSQFDIDTKMRIVEIIQEIQSCDQIVSEFVLTWRDQVDQLLKRLSPKL